jgi:hypothetical protein
MLIVKVELWPRGDHHLVREIGLAALVNLESIPGTADEYRYLALLRDDRHTEHLTVLTHTRHLGFWPLVGQAVTHVQRPRPRPVSHPPTRVEQIRHGMYADQPEQIKDP